MTASWIRRAVIVCSAALTGISSFAGEKSLAREIPSNKTVPTSANRAYRIVLPDADWKNGAKFPLVIYLHGAGAKGQDNLKPLGEVMPRLLNQPQLREKFPCFILIPQCRAGDDAEGRPNNWVKWEGQKTNPPAKWMKGEAEPSDQLLAAMQALDEVLANYPVDTSRIYLTGVSMGGSGTWNWAARQPGRFAAIITSCGLSETSKASSLAKLPIWAFHGSDDEVAPAERSRQMIEALCRAGNSPRYSEFTGAGHNIAERVFTENEHAAFTWLFAQRKGNTP